jgi:hypothetical protein
LYKHFSGLPNAADLLPSILSWGVSSAQVIDYDVRIAIFADGVSNFEM